MYINLPFNSSLRVLGLVEEEDMCKFPSKNYLDKVHFTCGSWYIYKINGNIPYWKEIREVKPKEKL